MRNSGSLQVLGVSGGSREGVSITDAKSDEPGSRPTTWALGSESSLFWHRFWPRSRGPRSRGDPSRSASGPLGSAPRPKPAPEKPKTVRLQASSAHAQAILLLIELRSGDGRSQEGPPESYPPRRTAKRSPRGAQCFWACASGRRGRRGSGAYSGGRLAATWPSIGAGGSERMMRVASSAFRGCQNARGVSRANLCPTFQAAGRMRAPAPGGHTWRCQPRLRVCIDSGSYLGPARAKATFRGELVPDDVCGRLRFPESLLDVASSALGHREALRRWGGAASARLGKPRPEDLVFWICLFALNQHRAGEEVGSSPEEGPFNAALMQAPS